MSAQKAILGVRRIGKEAYQFQFTSVFEYITLDCSGTWRPTLLKVVWFRSHRKVESLPVKWVANEDNGPNGAVGKAKFKPVFSVGLLITLYKDKLKDTFEDKEYKYYIEDESEKGTKVLASFTIDLKDYAKPQDMGSRDVFEMTFQNESRKVRQVVLGMTLTSQLLKRGRAIDSDMQSTFSAMTSDSQQLSVSDDETTTEGGTIEVHTTQDTTLSQMDIDHGTHPSTEVKLELGREGVSPPKTDTVNDRPPPIVTVTTQAPTPLEPPAQITLQPSQTSNPPPLQPNSRSPSPLLSSHTPSPSHSPSPSPKTRKKARNNFAFFGGNKPAKKGKENEHPVGNLSGGLRVSIESSQERSANGDDTVPLSPPPPSPLPTVTDSTHRPWEEINDMVTQLKRSVIQLEKEKEQLHASMEIQGWLYKRGVKGLTANVWRRRFFRVEGSRIYYYKTMCATQAQGFIDIDLVLGVHEVGPEMQDKNGSTFLVRCDGRTFQLQAMDQPTMRKWMRAIQFLSDFRQAKRNGRADVDLYSQL